MQRGKYDRIRGSSDIGSLALLPISLVQSAGCWVVTSRWVRPFDRAGMVLAISIGLGLGAGFLMTGVRPLDTDTFWSAAHTSQIYGETWGIDGSRYVYPPVLAQILAIIPWPHFLLAWTLLVWVALWYAAREWFLLVVLVGASSIAVFGWTAPLAHPLLLTGVGNPQSIIAAICVVGLRRPELWAFSILTKLAPGIGLLWFAVRGEWKRLTVAIGATAAVAATSFALDPELWRAFGRFAVANAGATSPEPVLPIPFVLRVSMSAAIVVWGARTGRTWTVPLAVGWSAVALYQWSYLTVWVAALPLAAGHARDHRRVSARTGTNHLPRSSDDSFSEPQPAGKE